VDGEPFDEGARVTVVAPENGESFELSVADETALLAAIEEADLDDVADSDEVLRGLGKRN
jgi:hypothetical protein